MDGKVFGWGEEKYFKEGEKRKMLLSAIYSLMNFCPAAASVALMYVAAVGKREPFQTLICGQQRKEKGMEKKKRGRKRLCHFSASKHNVIRKKGAAGRGREREETFCKGEKCARRQG